MHQNFARSMSLADAMSPDNILCYEMNGADLPAPNGAPLRLIAPGWYGIANVKWLKRIEVRDQRFKSRFMARDYVTIREEEHDGETVWAETSVGRARLKSAPARVTRNDAGYRIVGVAWGAPIEKVEVKIDDGPWQQATIDHTEEAEYAWKIWSLDWPAPAPGEHTVTSRATDTSGQVQPAMDDPWIAKKHTYWESNGQVTRRVNNERLLVDGDRHGGGEEGLGGRADLEDRLGVHRLAALAANPEALGIDQPVAGDDADGEPGQVEILHAGGDVGLELGRQGCDAVLHELLCLHPGSEACERERERESTG